MKRVSKLFLEDAAALTNQELRSITGGYVQQDGFTCYCGFTGGEYEDQPFQIESDSIGGALDKAGSWCGGLGATCSGN